jgi:hypothetical protein
MYDKQGSVLRVETTINDVDGFSTFRVPQGKPDAPKSKQRRRKGIADLYPGVSFTARERAETPD